MPPSIIVKVFAYHDNGEKRAAAQHIDPILYLDSFDKMAMLNTAANNMKANLANKGLRWSCVKIYRED